MMKQTLMMMAIMATMPLTILAEDKDTTVVIPETGHLAVKTSRNFKGPQGVIVSSFTGSGNTSSPGISFNNQELGDGVVISQTPGSNTGLILTAQPGTYTLTLTDDSATKQFFSTSAYWTAEPGKVFKKDARIYKFVNTPERVGFLRDETYASDNYQYCDMADGEHLYFPVTSKPMDRITATLGTTAEALDFIPWSETWKCPMVNTTAIREVRNSSVNADTAVYDLQGRRISRQPQKGLYIINGKKFIAR